MFRVLVLGKTQEIAEEAASWAVSGEKLENTYGKKYEIGERSAVIRTFPLWFKQKVAPAIGDAVLVVVKTPEDLSPIKSLMKHYQRIPLKFVLYDPEANQEDFKVHFKAVPITKGTATEFVEKLIEANNELIKLIATVFKNFDKDNDGFIELKELQAFSKELGSEFNPEEAKKMIKIMDVNKDGKISLEEFIGWWKAGCRGNSQKILCMLKKLGKKNPFLKKAITSLESVKPALETDKLANVKLGVYLNKIEKTGMLFDITILGTGKELEEEFKIFSEGIGVSKNDLFAGFSFGVKNPAEAANTLKEIINTFVMIGTNLFAKAADVLSDLEFNFGSVKDKAIACAIPSVKGSTDLAPLMPFIEKLLTLMLPNQSLSMKFCTATDFEKLSIEDRSFVDLLFDGISFEILGQLNPFMKERIGSIFKAPNITGNIPAHLKTPLKNLCNLPLSSFNGEVEFEPTPELKNLLKEPMGDMFFSTPAKDLKKEYGPELKNSISALPILETVHQFFRDEITNINLLIYLCNLGAIRMRLDIPGLSLALDF